MNAASAPAGFYPERLAPAESPADRAWSAGDFWIQQRLHRRVIDPAPLAAETARHAARLQEGSLAECVPGLRFRLRRALRPADMLAECFGLYGAALQRACPQAGVASPEVLGAARALVEGGIVELGAAGDRHLALAFAAAVAALRGTPVHLLAASEPRAQALAETLRGPFAALGIGIGLVIPRLAESARYDAYSNLVVCGVAREIGLDYLRDRVSLGGRLRQVLGTLDRLSGEATGTQRTFLPGMRCALVEEADQVMLDDTRVPLAVSTEADDTGERLACEQALELARVLHVPADFSIGHEGAMLMAQGSQRIAQLVQALGGVWAGREGREELIVLALNALHLWQRDRDYQVSQGRVVFPPRPAEEEEEDDVGQLLLQRLVEVKEGCRLGGRRVVVAQISVPRMLGRYLHLGGVCEDARGLESEFWELYRLRTVRAAEYPQPMPWGARLFATAAAKRNALVEAMRTSSRDGAAVVALRSPAEAQALLEACTEAGIGATLVRGTGAADERQAIADLAARGTVILTLYPAERTVRRAQQSRAPLHLLVAELHDARRHIAHIARAYDARTCEIMLSLEDDALNAHLGARDRAAAARAIGKAGEATTERARHWVEVALRNIERAVTLARRDAASTERNLDELLAFAGQRE